MTAEDRLARIKYTLGQHGIVCTSDDQVALQVERVLKVLSYFVGVNQTATVKRARRWEDLLL